MNNKGASVNLCLLVHVSFSVLNAKTVYVRKD